jgi:transposase
MVGMRHRSFELTDAAARALLAAYHNARDGAHRTRLQAVRLYGIGYQVSQIVEITGCARSSLMEWCAAYRADGIPALADHRRGGNHAKLTPAQVADLSAKLRVYSPRSLFGPHATTTDGQTWTVDDLRCAVQEWYHVSYASPTSYTTLFARCGFSYHRPSQVFKSRNEAAVADFEAQIEKTDRHRATSARDGASGN